MKRRMLIGFLALVLTSCTPAFTVTFTEAQINELAAPYLGNIPGAGGIYVDLIPNGVYVSARVSRFGQRLRVGATAPVVVRDGRIKVFVTQAWLGGQPAPAWVAQTLDDSVAPRINAALDQELGRRFPMRFVEITDVWVTDTEMKVRFVLRVL